MKRTKIVIVSAFVLGIGSAFTTKQVGSSFTSVKEAVTGTDKPCTMTTASCDGSGPICTVGTSTYFPADESGCVTPLHKSAR